MAAFDVTDARLLLLDEEEDPDEEVHDADGELEEALGDEEEEDVPEEVLVSRSKLPTWCLPLPEPGACCCWLVPPTDTKPPLDRLSE